MNLYRSSTLSHTKDTMRMLPCYVYTYMLFLLGLSLVRDSISLGNILDRNVCLISEMSVDFFS